jgi:hypothetical protein
MSSKIVPINGGPRKYEVFNIFVGRIDDQNQIVESERVGVAFLKGKSKVFSLRLWMFDSSKYFVAPSDEDSTKYDVLSLEEYTSRDGEERSNWRKVGSGQYFGNYLKLKFHLIDRELYLSLFPNQKEPIESAA